MKNLVLTILLSMGICNTIPESYYLVHKESYVSIYDCDMEAVRECAWILHTYDMGNAKRVKGWRFKADIPVKQAQARSDDYSNSGYQRGHLCPAQDRSANAKGMKSTFSMSNIAPQTQRLNDGDWKRTEDVCRKFAQQYDSVWVVVVPVFLNRDTTLIGKHNVAVPHAFFKAVVTAKGDSVLQTWFLFNR